jgi:mono/diheme cytochrome c family protein
MTRSTFICLAVLPVLALATDNQRPSRQSQADAQRGKYIVEQVAMCGQCHTPRTESGELIRSQWLAGASVPVSAPYRNKPWASFAPRIAGLNQFTDEQAVRLLAEGINRTGETMRAPMPPFRMSAQDANDVVAYLRSLE